MQGIAVACLGTAAPSFINDLERRDRIVYQILAIDDNKLLFGPVKQEWERRSAILTQAVDVQEAFCELQRKSYNLIVILSRRSLVELLAMIAELKAVTDLPILALAEQYIGADKITAIHHGADDYQPIPADIEEAAVSGIALIRRHSKKHDQDHVDKEGIIIRGGLIIDTACHTVKRNGQDITLTATEFKLLCFFAQHEGIVFTQDGLYLQVWKPGSMSSTSTNISNHIVSAL